MGFRVIDPPEPIVTPADIAGGHAANDASVAAMIQAVTEDIDGPGGWLGRSLGPQTIEATVECWGDRSQRLPFGPVIDIVSVVYDDEAGVEQTVDAAHYSRRGDLIWFRPAWSAPRLACQPGPIRITYRAGYDGQSLMDGGTGPVPERARQAIITSVQHLRALSVENLFLRSVEIPDVLTEQYTLSDVAGRIVKQTCDRLLSTLQVFS